MKANGPRLDGAATSAGIEEGRVGWACFSCAEGGCWVSPLVGLKNNPRRPGLRGSSELGEDHHNPRCPFNVLMRGSHPSVAAVST